MTDDLTLRWWCMGDMPEILDIEHRCYRPAWTKKDFRWHASQNDCELKVVERGDRVVGFVCYWLYPKHLNILGMAVHPEDQRCGIGTFMMERVLNGLRPEKRTMACVDISERNVGAQLFLRSQGFSWTRTTRGLVKEPVECDAYTFEHRILEQAQLPVA